MKYTIDCKEFEILRNKKIPQSYIEICKKAHSKNKKIFGRKISKYKIYICDNDNELRKYSLLKLDISKVSGAATRKGCVAIRSPASLSKIPYGHKNQFEGTIIHEINHVFWKHEYKDWKPAWLSEGLAHNVCGTFSWPKNYEYDASEYYQDHKFLDYRWMENKVNQEIQTKYWLWTAFTQYLIRKKGMKTIIEFMDEFSKNNIKENYKKQIQKHFGNNLKKLFADFKATHRKYIGPKKL